MGDRPSRSDADLVRRTPGVIASPAGEDLIILDVARGDYLQLNGVGAAIWALLETPLAIGALQNALLERFVVEAGVCRADLESFLGVAAERGLVTITPG